MIETAIKETNAVDLQCFVPKIPIVDLLQGGVVVPDSVRIVAVSIVPVVKIKPKQRPGEKQRSNPHTIRFTGHGCTEPFPDRIAQAGGSNKDKCPSPEGVFEDHEQARASKRSEHGKPNVKLFLFRRQSHRTLTDDGYDPPKRIAPFRCTASIFIALSLGDKFLCSPGQPVGKVEPWKTVKSLENRAC
jgi:hypothetical protein